VAHGCFRPSSAGRGVRRGAWKRAAAVTPWGWQLGRPTGARPVALPTPTEIQVGGRDAGSSKGSVRRRFNHPPKGRKAGGTGGRRSSPVGPAGAPSKGPRLRSGVDGSGFPMGGGSGGGFDRLVGQNFKLGGRGETKVGFSWGFALSGGPTGPRRVQKLNKFGVGLRVDHRSGACLDGVDKGRGDCSWGPRPRGTYKRGWVKSSPQLGDKLPVG